MKALFLSCRCSGNVTVIARLLRMNRGDTLPIYLIYDQPGELPEAHVKGLKKLGIKVARRQKMAQKMDSLIRLHLTGKTGKKAEKAKVTALTPVAVKGRVMADIETMTKLPPLPQVYEKITKLARDPKSEMKDWIKAIEVEPMTCATILKHANSSALGFIAEVTNIERAVVLLGKNTVAGLVAGEAVRQSFTAVEDSGFKLEEFWLHNLAVGYSSHLLSLEVNTDPDEDGPKGETIANAGLDEEAVETLKKIDFPSRLKLPKGSPCFIAGTMHDIGKGVIVQSYPGLFPVLLEELEAKKWSVPMLEAERVVAGGLTHPLAGELLMRSWGLSGQLGSVVLSHHQPEHDDHLTFLKLRLHAASSAPDTDWIAKLTWVRPGGASVIISGGILRARYRRSLSRPQLLEPNKPELFEIDMTATATVIPAGHRLRLTLTSSDFPAFDRNPNTGGPIGRERRWQTAINLLFHDRLRPSHILLPVLGE